MAQGQNYHSLDAQLEQYMGLAKLVLNRESWECQAIFQTTDAKPS